MENGICHKLLANKWVVLFPLIVPACSKLSEFEKPFCFHNQSLCVFGKHLFLSKPIVHNHCYCDVGKVDDPFRCKALQIYATSWNMRARFCRKKNTIFVKLLSAHLSCC